MKTRILSGREVAASVYRELTGRIENLKEYHVVPGLAVILVGDDPASAVYVRSKTRKFRQLNLVSETIVLSADCSQETLLDQIEAFNGDDRYHGILVQFPLPAHLDQDRVLEAIDPKKDVDGLHPYNLGLLVSERPRFIPCTPKGILRILEYFEYSLARKQVVIVGRSKLVGRPLSILTSMKKSWSNATTTICHSGTKDLSSITQMADFLILAMGSPEFLTRSDIKPGAVVIDVGINRVEDDSEKGYRLVGDAQTTSLMGRAGALTPVPGGVGPMTIAMLVENTVEAAERQVGLL
jgi:methylenetetrahydrofolate dehydrogenase (NADP+)/methenyltetrahydrofolate cyclohydrolase